jgi:hypothetical protein
VIEPVLEFGEISRHVFFAYGPVGSRQEGLNISKRSVDPFEGWLLDGPGAATSFDLGMRATCVCCRGEACKPI